MAKSKKAAARKTDGVGARRAEAEVALSIDVTSGPDTPTYYINMAEIHHTAHEFGMAVVRTPGKMPKERLEALKTAGQLVVPADVLLLFPPTMLPGLIEALTLQRDKFESRFGPIVREKKT